MQHWKKLILLQAFLFSLASAAEPEKDDKKEEAKNPFSGSVSFVSDYLNRGISQTFGGSAVQGDMTFKQTGDKGVKVSVWGSSVGNDSFSNSSGGSYTATVGGFYNFNDDWSFALDGALSYFPKAYNNVPSKTSYNMFEIVPTLSYKFINWFWAYSVTDSGGLNAQTAASSSPLLQPNGNSRGSWYMELNASFPIRDCWTLDMAIGRQYVRHYSAKSYNVGSVGSSYTLPDEWGGFKLSISLSATSAKRAYYMTTNSNSESRFGGSKRIVFGIQKSLKA